MAWHPPSEENGKCSKSETKWPAAASLDIEARLAMPLQTPYSVIIGAFDHAELANPTGGQWPHYHVHVRAGSTLFDAAINLKSLASIQIEYRVRTFVDPDPFIQVTNLDDGLHHLSSDSTSGAWDYVRHPALAGGSGWILQNGDNLIQQLAAQLVNVERLYIFGAEYSTHDGVHDVHMNQGDPDGSSFQPLDGIWQDGGVMFHYGGPQPRLDVLQIKFETQSLHTDDQGHPLHWRHIDVPMYMPRWWWPPCDPLTEVEVRELIEAGLGQLASWAAAIPELHPRTAEAAREDLRSELRRSFPEADDRFHSAAAEFAIRFGRARLAYWQATNRNGAP